MPTPRFQQFVHDLVDLTLAVDVDAAGGLIEDQYLGIGAEPLGYDDLLLVSAESCIAVVYASGALMASRTMYSLISLSILPWLTIPIVVRRSRLGSA